MNVVGAYGTEMYPGGRRDHSMVISPSLNCIYVFGGYGLAQTTTAGASMILSGSL